MQITIHRGINQIGGCITEIATANTRIIIDLGLNLPDSKGLTNDNLANNREAVERLTDGIDAIFYTHYHGDHMGLFNLVNQQHLSQTIHSSQLIIPTMRKFTLKILTTILLLIAILFTFIVDAGAFVTQLSICALIFILLITAYLLYSDHKKS